ncbi:chimeric protein (plasmid) [Haloferax gibbonsii]|uniref:Chimeric protein n=1 Tax=Haloferax gibbonsii TaxID=35746 RepID=A0A871BLZ5_HALGI|nr:chimeric protein [Haloferax gibbonsii]
MWSVDRRGTKSFIEFVSTYLPDHPEHPADRIGTHLLYGAFRGRE